MKRAAILVAVCLVLLAGCAREIDTTTAEPPTQAVMSLVVDKPQTPAPTPAPTLEPDP